MLLGVPEADKLPAEAADAEAVVFALKTRSTQASEAVRQSLAAARCLRSAGCRHLYFKYCSTFDSTNAGNIGPVADALLDEVGGDFTIFCPAFPKTGRKIFNGYLFVGPVLLSESGMQNHPLTPMTDPNLVRVLQGQTRYKVGLINFDSVKRGAAAIRAEMLKLRSEGVRYAIVDAVGEDDLAAIGVAALSEGLALTTGGSGLGGGLALNLRDFAETGIERTVKRFPAVQGPAAIIAGSCSRATLGQIEHFLKDGKPFFRVEIDSLLAGWEAGRRPSSCLGDGPTRKRTTTDCRKRVTNSRCTASAGARTRTRRSTDRKRAGRNRLPLGERWRETLDFRWR